MDSKALNERELEDDYPIHAGYLYVIDGKVVQSEISTTVGQLKRTFKSQFPNLSVKNCDIATRNLWHLAI